MVIRITIEVDEDRLFETGMGTTDAEITAAIEALRDKSWLSLQRDGSTGCRCGTRGSARLDMASKPKAEAPAAH